MPRTLIPTFVALLAGLSACTAVPQPAPLRFERPITLLGEVHDNAAQHAEGVAAFEAALASGARPALVMEQFDRERQPEIDRLRARQPPPDADALIAAAGAPGWAWPQYRPFVALALRHGLPIVAANVSRDDARQVMREGLAATGFDADVPAEVLAPIAASIAASHCGMLDVATADRMALAQVARDQSMARAVEVQAARGVLLIAGNGHVRTDVGVVRWLSPATRARVQAIGRLEPGGDDAGRFDRVIITPAQPRPDPCEEMRR